MEKATYLLVGISCRSICLCVCVFAFLLFIFLHYGPRCSITTIGRSYLCANVCVCSVHLGLLLCSYFCLLAWRGHTFAYFLKAAGQSPSPLSFSSFFQKSFKRIFLSYSKAKVMHFFHTFYQDSLRRGHFCAIRAGARAASVSEIRAPKKRMTLPFRLFFLFFLTILFFAGYLYLNFSPSSVHILTFCPFWWGDRDRILKKKKDSLFECRIIFFLFWMDHCCKWRVVAAGGRIFFLFFFLPLFPSSLLTYVPSLTVRGLLGAGTRVGESCW